MNTYKEEIVQYHLSHARANNYSMEDLFAFGENSYKRHSYWEEVPGQPGQYQMVHRSLEEMRKLSREDLM